MRKTIVFIIAGLALAACKSNSNPPEAADCTYRGDTLCIAVGAPLATKIKTDTLSEQAYRNEFNTTGIVKAITGKLAEIAAPFDGRVTKSYVQLGQKVAAGAPIFELSSTEFYEATKNYFQSTQTKKTAELTLQRQRDLEKNGVGARRDLEEAESAYEMALKEYEQAAANIKLFNLNPADLTMGQALKVTSPIAGEVVQSSMVIGQYVKSDAPPLAIVAELSKVWVVAQVKERYIGAIHTDDKVEIRTDAEPTEAIAGRVFHISELLDEETRAVQVLIECDNAQRKLKPGMFTGVHFISAPEPAIVIPATALLQTESESYVFVAVSSGKYVKRPVQATTGADGRMLVTKGLSAGDVVVAEGGIYLIN